jgi:hypothetical protein
VKQFRKAEFFLEVKTSVWPGCNLQHFVVNHASSQMNGEVMACIGRRLAWWDRDMDRTGRPIRADVRLAGHEIWEQACQRTHLLVADDGPAAELMEYTVAQVSRYLDRIGAPLSTRKHGLLLVAFCRALRRYAAKLSRLELAGGSGDLTNRSADNAWVRQVNARLDLESIVRQLSERNAAVLTLRAADYEWKEIAQLFGVSAGAARNSFWREIEKIRGGTQKPEPSYRSMLDPHINVNGMIRRIGSENMEERSSKLKYDPLHEVPGLSRK